MRLRASFDDDAARERLIKTLVEQGFGVRTVVDLESDLEALFLTLTGGGATPASSSSFTQPGGVA